MIESLKPLYNSFLRPFSSFLARLGIHPNVLTIMGVLLFAVGGWLIVIGHWRISLIVGVIGAFMDGLDGILAREFDKKSVFGGILDSTCDRFTEIIWLGSLIVYYLNNDIYVNIAVNLAFLAITGSLMVSYIRARAEAAGIKCEKGILQRPERLIVLAIFQFAGPYFMLFGLAAVTFFSYLTVFQRLLIVWKNCQKHS